MRIPFDLIAAVICIEGIGAHLAGSRTREPDPSLPAALAAWAAFLLVTWLLHELIARDLEWRTRFGQHPEGVGEKPRHPVAIHIWATRAVQAISVLLFAAILLQFNWPLYVQRWPQWLGLGEQRAIGHLPLGASLLAAMVLNLTPYLLAMLVSWLPRWRVACERRRRRIPLRPYLAYEAKLTWVPVLLWLGIAILHDLALALPPSYSAWMESPVAAAALPVLGVVFIFAIAMPKLVIWWWGCTPLPDGQLKQRLLRIVERSGVKARAIMTWGPRGSGLLNACVLGPWSRFRYVLISPQLVEELGMEETEAVLAHELGHARYGHLGLLFVTVLCLSALLDPLIKLLHAHGHVSPLLQALVAIVFVIVYIWGFFGALMRQCEREADLASAELMGTPAPLVAALEKLALLTGNIRGVWCWNHGSIAERVASVQRLSVDPDGSRRFHARLRAMRIAFTVLTAAALGLQVFEWLP